MRRVNYLLVRQTPPPRVRGINTWIPAFAGMTILMVGAVLMLGGAFATKTFADGPYKIDWYTIDGGGGTSTGGQYMLTGTIGQPDAGYSADTRYELLGGFWPGGAVLCIVDFDELTGFCRHWLETGAGIKADLDKNQKVDFVDYSILADSWLKQCPLN